MQNNCNGMRLAGQFGVSFLALITAQAVTAQTGAVSTSEAQGKSLGDIVVTANKHGAENIQRVPSGISVVSSNTLRKTAAQSIQEFSKSVPGLAIFDDGANQKKVRIRGVSGSAESEPNETVGIYLDDVSITNPGGTNNENNSSPDVNLFDIARIEVLKGPQGTLYGAGSMGGTIRYITNTPDLTKIEGEVQGRTSFTRSGTPSYGGDAMLNVPLIGDKLALRLVGSYNRNGGYINNVAPVGPADIRPGTTSSNFNHDSSWLVRGAIFFRPVETYDITLKYVHRQANVNGASAAPFGGDKLTSNFGFTPSSTSNLDIFNGVVNYHLGFATLTSSTSYLDRHDIGLRDATQLAQLLVAGSPSIPLANINGYHEFSQELRVASDSKGRLKYVLGLYYSDLHKRFNQDSSWIGMQDFNDEHGPIPLLANYTPMYSPYFGDVDYNFYYANVTSQLRQVAIFGEATYSITDRIDINAGGRYFDMKQHYLFDAEANAILITPDATFRASKLNEHGFNPKATLSFKAARDVLLYATAAKGFRPGGFNQPVPATPQCQADFAQIGFNPNSVPGFRSDSLWSYEAGIKSQFADHKVQLNLSGYQIDWKNIQLRNALSCGFTVFDTASKARIRGLEGYGAVRPVAGLTLSVNAAYTDAKLLDASATTGAVAGQHLLGVPRVTVTGAAEYDFPMSDDLGAFVRADANYISHYDSYFTAAQNHVLGGFTIVNLSIGVDAANENWGVQLFGKNIFNRIADTGAQNDVFGDYIFHNRPREIGMQLHTRF